MLLAEVWRRWWDGTRGDHDGRGDPGLCFGLGSLPTALVERGSIHPTFVSSETATAVKSKIWLHPVFVGFAVGPV